MIARHYDRRRKVKLEFATRRHADFDRIRPPAHRQSHHRIAHRPRPVRQSLSLLPKNQSIPVDLVSTTRHTSPKCPKPGNDWYHVTLHAYGSWLRGDPRGWRERHHREHRVGDYRNPPPKGKFERIHARSKFLMTRDPVSIAQNLRQFVVEAIVERLQREEIETLIASADAKHVHVLARFTDHRPEHWIGLAKKHASHLLRQEGLRTDKGGLWAKRARAEPIKDRKHQLNTFRYILAHSQKGAAIWTFTPARQ